MNGQRPLWTYSWWICCPYRRCYNGRKPRERIIIGTEKTMCKRIGSSWHPIASEQRLNMLMIYVVRTFVERTVWRKDCNHKVNNGKKTPNNKPHKIVQILVHKLSMIKICIIKNTTSWCKNTKCSANVKKVTQNFSIFIDCCNCYHLTIEGKKKRRNPLWIQGFRLS